LSPACITNTFSKVMIFNHIIYIQIFNRYIPIVINYFTRFFIGKVFSLVAYFKMLCRQKFNCFSSIATTFFTSGNFSLSFSKFYLTFPKKLGVLYKFIFTYLKEVCRNSSVA
jgi:hypothetical protein